MLNLAFFGNFLVFAFVAVAVQAPRKLQNDVWIFSFNALKFEIEIKKGKLALAALAKMNFYMTA